MRHCTTPSSRHATFEHSRVHALKGEVDLTITKPITSNNFCNSLADLRVGYSHLEECILYASSIITSIMQYSQAVSFAPCAQFFRSSFSPARITFSWQGMFFIYFRVISDEFVSASLRKPCGFFRWFLTGLPLILFLRNDNFSK